VQQTPGRERQARTDERGSPRRGGQRRYRQRRIEHDRGLGERRIGEPRPRGHRRRWVGGRSGAGQPDAAPPQDAGVPGKPLGKTVMSEETIGGLKIGASAKDVIAVLGKPRKKTKPESSEATGDVTSAWSWPGIGLSMVKARHGFEVQSIEINAPSTFATSRGIAIGSSKADVENSYQRSTEGSGDDPNSYLVGSPYGGELFTFKNGKVIEIFLGQMAE